jgi:hypothetical protein
MEGKQTIVHLHLLLSVGASMYDKVGLCHFTLSIQGVQQIFRRPTVEVG